MNKIPKDVRAEALTNPTITHTRSFQCDPYKSKKNYGLRLKSTIESSYH